MRIHVHTGTGREQPITPELWAEAAGRAPDIGAGHEVSFGATTDALSEALGECEMVVFTHRLPRPLPAPAPRLRHLFCTYAGIDGLMPLDWLPPGVGLLNNRGTHGAKAGEFAIMSLLMLASHVPGFVADQRAQRWNRRHGTVLAGRRLTVVGLGTLGAEAARRGAEFGLRVTGVRARPAPHPSCERVVGSDSLDAVLPDTEFLLLACPLTAETRGLLDERRIGLLPQGAFVVNIGRGALLAQDALCDALEDGRLGGAVLDVFTPEPVPPGHRLWTTPNLVMTPHVSCDDSEFYLQHSLDILMENLRAIRDGQPPPNLVDPLRGY